MMLSMYFLRLFFFFKQKTSYEMRISGWSSDVCSADLTPGHVDFTIEVERSLRVLDGAVACFDGVAGVEPQSETVWRQAEKYHVPRMCFVNKLDRTGANFEMCVGMIKDRLGARPAVLYLPVGIEGGFKGLVDLVENRAIIWLEESLGAKFEYQDIPDDMKDAVATARSELIEMAVEQDDEHGRAQV